MGRGSVAATYPQYDTKHQNEWQNGGSAKVYVEHPRRISEGTEVLISYST